MNESSYPKYNSPAGVADRECPIRAGLVDEILAKFEEAKERANEKVPQLS